ncbi:MAG: ABC transporter ATP-binding protein/permease, partial [Candidatus Heimdallarchaeota archaeon]|nr:ABC transporter ATP-binding protein/permease [Candidatus Heimdallarchaeota archaeon]
MRRFVEFERLKVVSDKNLFLFAIRYMRNYRLLVTLSILFVIIGTILNLIPELLIRKIIDIDIKNKDIEGLLLSVLLMVLIYIISWLINFLDSFTTTKIGQSTIKDLRNDMFIKMVNQSQSFYDKEQSGSINSKMTNDLNTLAGFFSSGLVDIITSFLQLIGIFTIMLILDTALSIISMLVVPLLLAVTFGLKGPIRKISQIRRKTIAKVTTNLAENISGVKESKNFAREKVNQKEFEKVNKENFDAAIKATSLFALLFPLIGIITALGTAAVLYYSGYQASVENNPKYTVGLIATFMAYLVRFFGPVFTISSFYSVYQSALASLERVYLFMNEDIIIANQEVTTEFKNVNAELLIKNVYFSYNENIPIFEDLSLNIPGKSTVALVGHTGAGKSSIIKLIARFYDINSGSITIDGINIQNTSLTELRESIGIVPQKPILFNTSIRDNIKYGKLSATDDEIIEICKLLGLHEFIMTLPENYDTVVSEGGKRLSQGQRQLVTFARALIKNPPIIILDEATSSLDPISEIRI